MKRNLFFIILGAVMLLSGCQNQTKNSYQITFDSRGGEHVDTISVYEDQTITLPNITRENLHFIGWFDLLNPNSQPIFHLTEVSRDMNLFAKWEVHVLFYDADSVPIGVTRYELGSNESLLSYPDEEIDFDFIGWFDEYGNQHFDSSTIEQDISLYPLVEIDIHFQTNANDQIPTITMKRYEEVSLPTPTKEYYTFQGWYYDEDYTSSIDTTSVLHSHTTLYAKWVLSATYIDNFIIESYENGVVISGVSTHVHTIIVPSHINNKSVLGIKDYAFSNQSEIQALIFEENSEVEFIGVEAFRSTSIISLTLPESLTTIKFGAFKGVLSLVEVVFPTSIESIEQEAFGSTEWYQQLKNYQLVINDKLFFYKGNESSITISNQVREIQDYAFLGNTSIKTIYFEENSQVSLFSQFTFIGSRVEIINVPDSVVEIGNRSFENNIYLKTLHFGQNSKLEIIGEHAFEKSGLLNAIFPSSVKVIGIDAFSQTPWLGEYASDFVVIGDILVRFKGHITTVTIPNNIKVIGPKAMAFNFVKNVIISNSVERIEKQAFIGTHLDSITFEANSKLKYIGVEAFLNNYVKGDIMIPESVTFIDNGAFSNCINLKSITFIAQTPPQIGSIFLTTDLSRVKIFVPSDLLMVYKNNSYFSPYETIIFGQ